MEQNDQLGQRLMQSNTSFKPADTSSSSSSKTGVIKAEPASHGQNPVPVSPQVEFSYDKLISL